MIYQSLDANVSTEDIKGLIKKHYTKSSITNVILIGNDKIK